MSLLTRCPACTTHYRVVPDQLRISDGWVKCGQCGDIFDASQHLIEMAVAVDGPSQPSPEHDTFNHITGSDQEPSAPIEPPAPTVAAHDVGQANPLLPDELSIEPSPQGVSADVVIQPTPTPTPSRHEPSMQGLLHTVSVDDHAVSMSSHASPESVMPWETPVTEPGRYDHEMDRPSNTTEGWSDVDAASFLKSPTNAPSSLRKTTQAALWFFGLMLTLTLVGQVIFQNKDWLSAKHPALKPLLVKFCETAGCEINPYQQIESLTIDSAHFEKLNEGVYQLGFVLKNTSDMPLALPSIELTLTDAQDQPLLKRVFTPAELASSSGELDAGTEWVSNVGLKLVLEPKLTTALGYRLLAFYP